MAPAGAARAGQAAGSAPPRAPRLSGSGAPPATPAGLARPIAGPAGHGSARPAGARAGVGRGAPVWSRDPPPLARPRPACSGGSRPGCTPRSQGSELQEGDDQTWTCARGKQERGVEEWRVPSRGPLPFPNSSPSPRNLGASADPLSSPVLWLRFQGGCGLWANITAPEENRICRTEMSQGPQPARVPTLTHVCDLL